MREKEQKRLPPYDLLYEGINLKEAIGNRGLRLLIPREHVFGRQRNNEYENKKRKQIEEALHRERMDFLLTNPIIMCAVPAVNKHLLLAIIDGHHRNRYSGIYPEITHMPCIVSTPEVIVEIINNQRLKDHKTEINPEEFIRTLFTDTAEVLAQLSPNKYPQMVPNVSSIDELKNRFASF